MIEKLSIRRIPREEIEAEHKARNNQRNAYADIPWDRDNLRPELSQVRKPICHYLAGYNVLEMLESINDIRNWSNGADYISADFNMDWHLIQMHIGILIPDLAAYQIISPKKQEFLDIMEEILQLYQEDYPEKAEALQSAYATMVQKFSLHKYYT